MTSADPDFEALERAFWLRGREFYELAMTEDCVMVFPPPAGILTGGEVLDVITHAPRWSTVNFENLRVSSISDRVVALVYCADAIRAGGDDRYRAFATTVFVGEGREWRLSRHQQAPC